MSKRLSARMLAGFGLCAALSASAGPYSSLVVIGDSLSDSGNNALLLSAGGTQPLPPISIPNDSVFSKIPSASGTYSNGPVWTQYLAASLGLPTFAPSLAGGTNYAFGGAATGLDGNELPVEAPGFPYSMRTQLNSYLGNPATVVNPNALYVVAGGGNNIRAALEASAGLPDPAPLFASTVVGYATDMASMVADLKLRGAQHVLVLNTPNFGLTPLALTLSQMTGTDVSGTATMLSAAMNQALSTALTGSGAMTFDMFSFLTATVAAGPASGFSNWTNACAAAVNNCDVNTALFWDGIHPTTLAHQQLANAVLAVAVPVPEPDVAAMLALGLVVVALGARRRAGVKQG